MRAFPIVVTLLGGSLVALPSWSAPKRSGRTYAYRYDGKADRHPERAWWGRAYLPKKAWGAEEPLPLVVFLHGLNKQLIKYRWMGGGTEGDVRDIVGSMVDDGRLPPLIVAGPSSVVASQVSKGASWNHFDLDNFLDRTLERLDGLAKIDETRILVAGHSGAGCSQRGGLATASESRRPLLALLAIDTCMAPAFANSLSKTTSAACHVVVGYQTLAWKRPFKAFSRVFARGVKRYPAAAGILRELDHQKPAHAPHDATVKLTCERWLPRILPTSDE